MSTAAIYYPVAHRSQAQIDSFKTRYEDFEDTLIPEIFKQSLGLTALSWKPSDSWGSAHVIYFVTVPQYKKPLVLRANTGFGEPETVMLTEKLVTDKVRSVGLPTNHILHVDLTRKLVPFDFQIQETLEGTDPEVNFPDSHSEYDRLSFELGQYIARLSEVSLEGFGLFDAKALSTQQLVGQHPSMHDYVMTNVAEDLVYLVTAKVITPEVSSKIETLLEESKDLINIDQGTLVHHDLADHNLLYKDGHLSAVFDWETAVSGDVALDLASCPTWGTLYPREEQMLKGFQSIRELPSLWSEKRDIYRLRTMLWKMVYTIRANILTEARAQRFTNALKPFGLDAQ
jgi:aminoglycoside phosphotransferase (APT) family kinase protein